MRIGLAPVFLFAALPAFAGEIVIGQSAPLTGSNAELGNDIRNGALAYFKKVNDAGGLPQGKIRLVTLDDKNQTKLSEENTKKLVNEEHAVALFGYASSTLSIPAMPTVAEMKVPFFAPFTGADTIRKQNDYVYTVRSTYADEIGKIVNFWGNLGSTRVAVLHYDDKVGQENYETVAQALKKFGSTPTSVAVKRNADVTAEQVKQVAAANPNVLLVTTSYAPAAQLVKQLRSSGKQYMVTSLSFAGASQLGKALGPDASGVSVAIDVPAPRAQTIPVVRECNEAWAAAGQKEAMSVTAMESCIAAKVLVEGMKRSGKEVTRASLQHSLDGLGRYDAGGYVVQFKPGSHYSGTFVSIALLTPSGEVRE
jgi:ABC-type branched-subunit amino acid transport system substrate-binding protein